MKIRATRLAERTFYKGLVIIDFETENVKEARNIVPDNSRVDDIVTEDTPVTKIASTWIKEFKFPTPRGRNDNCRKEHGLQRKRKTVPHCRDHVQIGIAQSRNIALW